MSSSVAVQSKPTFSAPVVQSRLKHHHAQQLQQSLKPPKPEARHQRSKSLPKGRRIYTNGTVQSRETTANAAVNNSSTSTNNLLTNTPNRNPGNRSDGLDLSDRERYPTGLGIDVDQLLEEAKSKWQQQQQHQQHQQQQQQQRQRQQQHQHQQQQHPRQQRGGRRRHQHSDSVEESRVVPQVIVLRRPQSATDFVKHTAAATPLGSTTENDEPVVGQLQNDLRAARPSKQQQQPHARRAPSKERRRSDVPSSKAKRVQRRKDVKSMTDVLQVIDSDLLLGASPPPPARLYESADERDVHSITTTSSAKQVTSPVLGHHHNYQYVDPFDGEDAHKDNRLINLFNEPLTARAAPKRHSDSFSALSSVAINAAMPRRKSSTAVELQNQLARFKEFPAIEEGPRSESVRPSTHPGVHGGSPGRRMPGNLYAGPTFHNSPAPSDLPMPSFLRQSGGNASNTSPLMRDTSPGVAPNAPLLPKRSDGPQGRASPPGVAPNAPLLPRKSVPAMPFSDLSDDEGVFPMDDISGRSHADDIYARQQQQSLGLLQMLPRSHAAEHKAPQTPSAAYNVPERMATSRPLQVYPAQSLNELSESLRSLLKIPGQ